VRGVTADSDGVAVPPEVCPRQEGEHFDQFLRIGQPVGALDGQAEFRE
jgi:hypothetical protein